MSVITTIQNVLVTTTLSDSGSVSTSIQEPVVQINQSGGDTVITAMQGPAGAKGEPGDTPSASELAAAIINDAASSTEQTWSAAKIATFVSAQIAEALANLPDADTSPDSFEFTDLTDVPLSTYVVSNAVTITGINAPAPIIISGGEYTLDDDEGGWTSAIGTVANGQTVRLRVMTPSAFSAEGYVEISVGDIAAGWSATTLAADTTPDAFSFTPVTNAVRSTVYSSAAIEPTGINANAPISVTGGEVEIDGGDWITSGTFILGATLRVRLTSSANYSTASTATVTLGGVSATYTVTTLAEPVTAPPADWRMPITSAYDSAADSALVTSLANSSTAKTLPSYTVAAGATRTVALKVNDTGAGFIYFVNSSADITLAAAVSTNTTNGLSDGTWTALTAQLHGPADGSTQPKTGNGQWVSYPSGAAGRTVRFAVTAGASPATINIGTFKRLAMMDSLLVCSMSIYAIAYTSLATRDAIIAAHPTRDPIVFNWSVSGEATLGIRTHFNDAMGTDIPVSAVITQAGVNSWTSDAFPNSTTLDVIRNALRDIKTAADAKSLRFMMPRESWRNAKDIARYNLEVIDPLIQELAPDCYSTTYAMGECDLFSQFNESHGLLDDGTHPGPTGAAFFRNEVARTLYPTFINVAPGAQWVEGPVVLAETNPKTKVKYDRAKFNVDALPASSGKTALLARLAAILPEVLFNVATASVGTYETAKTNETKTIAIADVDAAEAAGWNSTDIAALRARIAAVVISAITRTFLARFGSTTTSDNFNAAAGAAAQAVIFDNMIDSTGAASTVDFNYTSSGTTSLTTGTGPTTTAIAWLPSALSNGYTTRSSPTIAFTLSGLDQTKVYDVEIYARRDSSSRTIRYTIGGTDAGVIDVNGNTSQTWRVNGIVPTAGVITIAGNVVSGASNCYITAMRIIEKTA